ncbi:hypothetical protein D1871_19495 [Nakamurella silvestris]|nr:hypothetical protein D1871_19495 [Nakamurella silvestris]
MAGALCGIPLTVLFTIVVIKPYYYNNYAVGATGAASMSMLIAGPLCAVCAALQTSRLRDVLTQIDVAVRRSVVVAFWNFLAVPLAGMSCFIAACVTVGLGSDVGPFVPDGAITSIFAAGTVFCTGLGVLAGRFLPTTVAVPACLLVCYFWIAVTPAMDTLWIRHLTGAVPECCTSDFVVSGDVLVANIALGIAGAFVVGALAVRRISVEALLLTIAVLGAASWFAVTRVDELDAYPVQPRTSGLTCAGSRPAVCVWEEHRGSLGGLVSQAGLIREEFAGMGLELPERVSESITGITDPSAGWVIHADRDAMSDADMRLDLVMGLLPVQPRTCGTRNPDQPRPVTDEYFEFELWLASKGGTADSELLNRVQDPEELAAVQAVDGYSPAQLGSWFSNNRHQFDYCVTDR